MSFNGSSSPIIQLEHITKRFPGVLALDDVSFSIFPGEVHAVLGENGAGKSTLMNILAGELQPDSGHVIYDGQRREIGSPLVSQKLGISVVYQELALCANLTIAENISLNSIANRSPFAFVNRGKFDQNAREVLGRLGLSNVNPRAVVGKLSVAQQQLVEIAKAISMQVRVLILDEPNSALTIEETEHLFAVLRQLQADGVAIIYVSHRLEEVLRIADRITVMRDGRYIDTALNDESLTIETLITKMVGRTVDHFFKRGFPPAAQDTVALEVQACTSESVVRDVSLQVRRGEVVGIAGLPDSGKDELVDCIFGLRPHTGSLLVNGVKAAIKSPVSAIQHGLSLIPADRRGAGAMLAMSVENNIVASTLYEVSQLGILKSAAIRAVGQHYVHQLDVRISSLKQKMRTLSGGNQQKIIIGRGLATRPSILLLHEPTRGIDVGAKAEIYAILHTLAQDGVAVLIISSELPELISQCDRILVMHQGRMNGEFGRENANEEAILACAMGRQSAQTEIPKDQKALEAL
jgi:ABC-type sugar transport system ATPase subunit